MNINGITIDDVKNIAVIFGSLGLRSIDATKAMKKIAEYPKTKNNKYLEEIKINLNEHEI